MCGIIALLLGEEEKVNNKNNKNNNTPPKQRHVNQLLFDGLTVLQHRGQDAAGMVTAESINGGGRRLHLRKSNGLVKDVFSPHHMVELRGNWGIGHCRYPTAGTSSCAEAQPLYTNYPFGIAVAHNGNLTNTEELAAKLLAADRHVNTDSDSDVLLNWFAECLTKETRSQSQDYDMVEAVFAAMRNVSLHCKGGYAGLFLINNFGLVGFRDPHGIRPLVFGTRQNDSHKTDYVLSSESVAIDTLGFDLVRDVRAGEAIFIDAQGTCHTRTVHPSPQLSPCIFEYVYFARPDSIMDGVSVYETRLAMGERLAEKIIKIHSENHGIDVVIPIPDTSRTCALQAAYKLNIHFREGFIKNRYIARTFIMPGQETRRKSVRLKLNTIKSEFAGRNVLLVDDSIVRGTTAHEIVQMARDAGARKVFFCSAAPPIRYPNIYGVDIPTREELIAFERNEAEIAAKIGCDWIVYQDLEDLEDSVKSVARTAQLHHDLTEFDTSCFSGTYVTGEKMGDLYFSKLYDLRNDEAKHQRNNENGCESLSNDTEKLAMGNGVVCESITNKPPEVPG